VNLSLEVKLVIFYVAAYALILVLRSRSHSSLAKAAFTWMGPRPIIGDSWARYQLRWALYSLGWLAQIGVTSINGRLRTSGPGKHLISFLSPASQFPQRSRYASDVSTT